MSTVSALKRLIGLGTWIAPGRNYLNFPASVARQRNLAEGRYWLRTHFT